jgi:hypothetical protein
MRMEKQFRWILIALFGVCVFGFTQGQNIEIRSFQQTGETLVVSYDLLDTIEGRSYSIRMYSSVDGFINPLEHVAGDIGLEVKPGRGKTISWQLLKELPPGFDGKVAIEIRGRLFLPFINTNAINQYKVFKRKREYNITWGGGTPQNILNFDLYHGDKKVHTFPNIANVGHYSMILPVHIQPGKGFRFRISDAKNKDEVVYSGEFKVKRKVPLLLKAIPIAMIGGGIYYLVTMKKENDDLGDPDKPGEGN